MAEYDFPFATPEERRALAESRAARAAELAGPTIAPAAVGLDVPMVEARGTPVSLAAPSMDVAPVSGDVVVPRGPAPREAAHGSDSGVQLVSGRGRQGGFREAGVESLRARGMSPAHELAGAEGAVADMYEQAGLEGLGMQGAQTVSSVANPDYGLTKRYVDTSRGITDAMPAAHAAVDDAEMVRAVKVADFMEEQANRQSEAISDMQARQFAQEEQAFEAQDRSKTAYALVDQTTKRMMDAPDVDPNRWWTSRSDGQKFAAGLAMLGRGVHMGDPLGAILPLIDRDIDAQKASFGQLQAASGAAGAQANAARGLYADIRAQTQDEREADEIMRIARLEQAKQQFEAMAAQTAIPSIKAAQDVTRLAFDQTIADRRMQLDKIAAHNVKRKAVVSKAYQMVQLPSGQVVRVPIGGPGQAAAAKYALEQADKNRGASRDVLAENVKGQASTEGQIAVNAAKAQAEAEAAESGINPENRRMIAKETAVPNRVRQLAGDLIKIIEERGGDVPGVGWRIPGLGTATHSLTAEARRFKKLNDELNQYNIVDLTGAVSSEKQDKILESITSDSETERLQGLRDLQRAMDVHINTIEAADPKAAKAIREHTRKGLEGWRGGNVAATPGESAAGVREHE
jgi:hypothetical protein